ncbi:hypothetical protein [Rhizobium sp. BK176]|uniref:hypothetical protein n=1 Tax=Rhizobium sp. BK176 TaxID=2587071 RepID=UPI00216A83AE|nr:hypothetical protein [Rhizobium sp. BK176]MCS4089018.1 hypothetical protein [Rhizobium sp. BK176]
MYDDMFAQPRNYVTRKFVPSAEASAATDGMAEHVFGTAFKIVATSILIMPFVIAFPPLVAMLFLAAGWNPEKRD